MQLRPDFGNISFKISVNYFIADFNLLLHIAHQAIPLTRLDRGVECVLYRMCSLNRKQ